MSYITRLIISYLILIPVHIYAGELPPSPLPSPSCEPSPEPSPQASESNAKFPIKCFTLATEMGLTFHQSILLCTNAKSLDPIRCFEEVFQLLTVDQKVNLCQGASSKGPVICMDNSFDLLLSLDQRIKLCNTAPLLSNTESDSIAAPIHCFRKAIKLLLSQDQRVILCADADSDDPVRCFIRSDQLPISFDQRVRLCTQLTPSSW